MNNPPPPPQGWGPPPDGGQPPPPGYGPPGYGPPGYGSVHGGEDQLAGLIAPVNVKNGMAMASGWLGILSLLCVGPILGIPAIITGVLALKKPELGGQGRAWTGIILGSLTTLLYGGFYLVRALS